MSVFDPGKPYNNAASQVRDLGLGAKDYSALQWQRQMEGLGQAYGAYSPAQAQWGATLGHQNSGQMENWYRDNANQFTGAGASEGAMNSMRGYMANTPQMNNSANMAMGYIDQPSQAEAYRRAQGTFGQQSDASNMFGQNQSLYNRAGAGENWFDQNQQQYQNIGQDRPSNAQNMFSQYGGQLGQAGRSEQVSVGGPNSLQNFASSLPYQQGANNTQQAAGEVGGYMRGASDISDYTRSQQSQLQNPGMFEQFAAQDIAGNNPELERSTAKGMAGLNQEMARRGHFNSGGAATALGEFAGSQSAADYQNKAKRAQDAQAAQLARISTGGNITQAASQNKLAQGTSLQGLAQGQDAETRARLDQQLRAQQASSSENLAGSDLQLRAAGQADQAQLARLQGLQSMATSGDQGLYQADALRLQALQGQQNAAMQSQQMGLSRANAGMTATGQMDDDTYRRQMGMYSMAQGQDANNLARANQVFGMGQAQDQFGLQRQQAYGNQANQYDASQLSRLMSQGGMANQAQSAEQQRQMNAFNSLLQLNAGQAGTVGGFYATGGQLAGQQYDNYLNLMTNGAQLQAQGTATTDALPGKLGGAGLDAYKAFKPSGGK